MEAQSLTQSDLAFVIVIICYAHLPDGSNDGIPAIFLRQLRKIPA